MKAKLIAFLVLTSALTAMLSSCDLFNPTIAPAIIGQTLSVDADGHLLVDATYQEASANATYGKDGSYEYVTSSWDAATSAWKQSSGSRGTYTYDPATYTLVTTYTSVFDGTDWVDYALTEARSNTSFIVLTQHARLSAYSFSNGTLVRTLTSTYTDSANTANSWESETVSTYLFNGTTFTYDYEWSQPEGLTNLYEESAHRSGTILGCFPEGLSPTVGAAVTYQCQETESTFTNYQGSVTTYTPSSYSYTITLVDADTAVFTTSSLTRALD